MHAASMRVCVCARAGTARSGCPAVPAGYVYLAQQAYAWNDIECGTTAATPLAALTTKCNADATCIAIAIMGNAAESVGRPAIPTHGQAVPSWLLDDVPTGVDLSSSIHGLLS